MARRPRPPHHRHLAARRDSPPGPRRLARGQWPFATSASTAAWALLSCRVPGGEPVCLLVPSQDWRAEDDWDTTGMRATASGTLTLARAAGEADAAALLLERAAACADQPPMTALDAARCRRDYWLAASLLTTAASRLFTTAGSRATSAAGPLARLWRDISTAAVHPALQPQRAASEWAARALGCQPGSEPP